MHGNVGEWCQDWYGTYPGGSVTDPQGPATGSYRVFRGGNWDGGASRLPVGAARQRRPPDVKDYHIGFRVVLSPGQP